MEDRCSCKDDPELADHLYLVVSKGGGDEQRPHSSNFGNPSLDQYLGCPQNTPIRHPPSFLVGTIKAVVLNHDCCLSGYCTDLLEYRGKSCLLL